MVDSKSHISALKIAWIHKIMTNKFNQFSALVDGTILPITNIIKCGSDCIVYLYSAQYLHILQDSKGYLPMRLYRYSPKSQVTDIPLTGR